MSIATKAGDQGQTSLYSGERVPKNHPLMELVGTLDELNAHLGFLSGEPILRLQNDLFELGAIVANPASTGNMDKELQRIEEELTDLESTLPPLTRFILPRGHQDACHLHTARAVCRRAERLLVEGLSTDLTLHPSALAYLNRLSDYLFQLARQANLKHGTEERFWRRQ